MTTGMTAYEASELLKLLDQNPDNPGLGFDMSGVVQSLGCQPDLVSIREALEEVVARGSH